MSVGCDGVRVCGGELCLRYTTVNVISHHCLVAEEVGHGRVTYVHRHIIFFIKCSEFSLNSPLE